MQIELRNCNSQKPFSKCFLFCNRVESMNQIPKTPNRLYVLLVDWMLATPPVSNETKIIIPLCRMLLKLAYVRAIFETGGYKTSWHLLSSRWLNRKLVLRLLWITSVLFSARWHGPKRTWRHYVRVPFRLVPCSHHHRLVGPWYRRPASLPSYQLWPTYKQRKLHSQVSQGCAFSKCVLCICIMVSPTCSEYQPANGSNSMLYQSSGLASLVTDVLQ